MLYFKTANKAVNFTLKHLSIKDVFKVFCEALHPLWCHYIATDTNNEKFLHKAV